MKPQIALVKDASNYNTGYVEIKGVLDEKDYSFSLFGVKEVVVDADSQPEVKIVKAQSLVQRHYTTLKTRTTTSENSYKICAGDIAVVNFAISKEGDSGV